MTKRVYADHAATTAVRPEALEAMLPFLREQYGNPSSLYSVGVEAARALADARARIAALLGAKPQEIIFTAGGSESDNMAIFGIMRKKKGHIITSAIEHHAVLHCVKQLEKEGCTATYIPVGADGVIDPADVEAAITEDTKLITIMMANNEIGTLQPIKEIAEIAKRYKIPFHTDAVQAVGHVAVNVAELGCDMLSLSGHKFGAPKGVGALYVRGGVYPLPLVHGGGQERNKRAGTENVPSIVAMATALEIAEKERESEAKRLCAMRDRLMDGILDTIPYSRVNGSREKRLPGNVNVSIEYIEGEALILMLDRKGICASSGSACTTGSLDPSHVLLALGLSHEVAHGSLRLSLGADNTMEDVEYILEQLPGIVQRLRDMSPLWEEVQK